MYKQLSIDLSIRFILHQNLQGDATFFMSEQTPQMLTGQTYGSRPNKKKKLNHLHYSPVIFPSVSFVGL